ncbi:MAG: serine O-acetyltransferase [Phycisphaerales bacterium]
MSTQTDANHALTTAAVAIRSSIEGDPRTRHLSGSAVGVPDGGVVPRAATVPDVHAVEELLDLARTLIFPGFFDRTPPSPATLEWFVAGHAARLHAHAQRQIGLAVHYMCGQPVRSAAGEDDGSFWAPWPVRFRRACRERGEGEVTELDCAEAARRTADAFLLGLAAVRGLMSADVQAAFDGDPAAEHTDEIILCYPGVRALLHHRLAHLLYNLGVPLLPRIIAETAHRLTGIDIHPGARIGARFFLDHGAGTVIGETAEIGDDVKLYQGVTLGAKSFARDQAGRLVRGTKRHPTLGNRVTIYAGAVILGGDTIIGDDCVINGGVFLTQGIPPGHIVRQKQAELTLRSNPALREKGEAQAMFDI